MAWRSAAGRGCASTAPGSTTAKRCRRSIFLYALAALSTLAGNLLIVGSLANIIMVERAAQCGLALGFWEHARCGMPITLLSFAVAAAWFALRA